MERFTAMVGLALGPLVLIVIFEHVCCRARKMYRTTPGGIRLRSSADISDDVGSDRSHAVGACSVDHRADPFASRRGGTRAGLWTAGAARPAVRHDGPAQDATARTGGPA